MSTSSLLAGTPAALSIPSINVASATIGNATITGTASVASATISGTLGVTGLTTAGNINSTQIVSTGSIQGVSLNATGAVSAGGAVISQTGQFLGAAGGGNIVLGDAASTSYVDGPGGSGRIYDAINNPAVVEFYAPPTIALPFTLPSSGDPNYTLLTIPVPVGAQNAKFYQIFFKFAGSQTLGAGTAQNWQIYLTETAQAAFNPATANSIAMNVDAGAVNPIWTGVVTPAATAGSSFSNGLFSVWYRPAVPGPFANLYLTIDATSASTAGGTLNAGFALDAICLAYN